MNLRAKIKLGNANTRLSMIPLGLLLVLIVGGQAYAQVDQQLNEEDGEVSQVSGESLLASWLPSVPEAHRVAPTRPEIAPAPADGIEELGTRVSCARYLACRVGIATEPGYYVDGAMYGAGSLIFSIQTGERVWVSWILEGGFANPKLLRDSSGKIFIYFDVDGPAPTGPPTWRN